MSCLSDVCAGIQREEDKVKRSIKAAAKRGDVSNAKTLAKEIVRSRKVVNRLHTSKAQMNSVMMQMENQMGACCSPLPLVSSAVTQVLTCYSLVCFRVPSRSATKGHWPHDQVY